MILQLFALLFLLVALQGAQATCQINRRRVVRSFNPHRNASSKTTPLQVGNGNFAFGVDVTGLQTFSPFATMSTWGWHNFSLPTTKGQTSVDDFTGLDWWTHGQLVNYNQPNPAESEISNWLIQNPQRVNLGTIGFWFNGQDVTEELLQNKSQTLDLWTGKISSSFTYNGTPVEVETWADPNSDTVGVAIESELFSKGSLSIFFDFPFPTQNKFDAPFVGVFNATDKHTTRLQRGESKATIQHDIDSTSYFTSILWDSDAAIAGPIEKTHRYVLQPLGETKKIELSVSFSPVLSTDIPSFSDITAASSIWWESFWRSSAFIDLSQVKSPNATELQRRTILSQYLTAVNSASSYPPQESGLVNNGWYGKFHLEMILWHLLHFARWNRFPLLWRSVPNTYSQYLDSSVTRAKLQGYDGARWGKMTDPTGRSAPGEINSLLIWQQSHPMYFAELEYRSFPNDTTLKAWDKVLTATADFMASYAFFNESTKYYDLGPPMYPASENTNPNATINPAFELAYWRFGLDIAIRWKQRQNLTIPDKWVGIRDNLAPLPTADDALAIYEGIPNMWREKATVQDHPAMSAIFGLLPPPSSGPTLNMTVVKNTADKIRDLWDLGDCWGWDFPMLAMNSLRLGDVDRAVAYLLHPLFEFDDAGYPVGGSRVPTPYFPGSSSFLLAMAMMAGGWDGKPGTHFPEGWDIQVEGFVPGL
ncbi:Six-hairpin glycosidase-like protein [Hypoxylon sp. NC0597]|nr:Six-hairpin glycosidase-like protein [Hypoxylon sp. NC0597]